MKQRILTAAQWALASYLAFWIIYTAVAMLSYVFTGATFNPLGMNNDRSAAAGITCMFASLGFASATWAKESK